MRRLKNILVTGGAGFIGLNFINCLFWLSATESSKWIKKNYIEMWR